MTLILKLDKSIMRKWLTNFSLNIDAKILQKIQQTKLSSI